MNKLCEPGEILPEEINRSRILVKGRNGMDTNCATSKGIVATGAASNGNDPECASAESEPTNGGSANRNEKADGRSPAGKETERDPANINEPSRQSSKVNHSSTTI